MSKSQESLGLFPNELQDTEPVSEDRANISFETLQLKIDSRILNKNMQHLGHSRYSKQVNQPSKFLSHQTIYYNETEWVEQYINWLKAEQIHEHNELTGSVASGNIFFSCDITKSTVDSLDSFSRSNANLPAAM